MRRIYLDANILVAYYSNTDDEKEKHAWVLKALDAFSNIPSDKLVTSSWAMTEMVKVLVITKKMDRDKVTEIENSFTGERRLGPLKIEFVPTSPLKDYDFNEFFYHVKRGILQYNSGFQDVVHSVIMKNNSIEHILTFDDKDDFKKIPGFVVMNPKSIKIEQG